MSLDELARARSHPVGSGQIQLVFLSSRTDSLVLVVQLCCLAPEIQPVADPLWWIWLRDAPLFRSTDGSCPGGPLALTGGAQHALSAAINLHHGGFERERGVCDRRYVSGNEVWVPESADTVCVCARVCVLPPAFDIRFHRPLNHFLTGDIWTLWTFETVNLFDVPHPGVEACVAKATTEWTFGQ